MAKLNPYLIGMSLLAVTACQQVDPAELRAQDEFACTEAGLTPDTDTFALCLMLQNNKRRMRDIENRLDFIELDVRRVGRLSRFPRTY